MKVSGFSIIRNAIKFDYPIVESIQSALPLCDEFIILVGHSDDQTFQLIKDIKDPKIKIFESVWDDQVKEGGKVLAIETDKAFNLISQDSDWALYLQADEILHEKDYAVIRDSMLKWKDDQKVEGFLFNYHHFYAAYSYIGDSRRWYRNEIRIIRNNPNIKAYRDAQGFRIKKKKLKVKKLNAHIYHYGWVKHPKIQFRKVKHSLEFWTSNKWLEKNCRNRDAYDYSQIDSVALFEGSHPKFMQKKIHNQNWDIYLSLTKKRFGVKDKILNAIENSLGWRIGEYRNYRIIK